MSTLGTILIVDDEPAHAGLIEILVGDVAPTAIVAVIEPSEVDSIADRAPLGASLLIDRHLGYRDALDVVSVLHERRPDLRVTVMSAFVTDQDREAAREAGASAVFEKPMDLDDWRNQLLAIVVAGVSERRAA